IALIQSGTLSVGAYQEVDRAKLRDKPRPGGKETPAARRGGEKDLHKTGEAFSQALNNGDIDALAGCCTEDAEVSPESGKAYHGRDAIRSLLKASLAENKGSKQTIKATSIRFIKPDVVSAEGLVTITTPDGEVDTGRFASIWVKRDGK